MQTGITTHDLLAFLPEFFLGGGVLILVVADLLVKDPARKRTILTWLTLAFVLAAGGAVVWLSTQSASSAFYGQIAIDPIGTLFKGLFVAIVASAVFTGSLSKELPDKHIGEYFILLLSIAFGMFLMASANDLLMVYLGIEMVSIVSYALAGYRMRDKRSSEAALKYVVYGGAASGIMLFGLSLLYGLFGTTELTSINHALSGWAAEYFAHTIKTGDVAFPLTVMTAIVFVFAGVGYKIAVVPFHMWSPDVYEGAPTPFSGFLSVGPKAAGFALLMRVMVGIFVTPAEQTGFLIDLQGNFDLAMDLPLPAMLGIISAVTMTVGNLGAIPQTNVKRMLAYSSIAHAGYLLMGFVVLSPSSMHAVVLYLVFYYMMNLGAFTVCQAVRDRTGGEMLHDFRGLGSREPLLAIFMAIFLVSLTGLPPLAGFIGKFYLFAAVIERGGNWYVTLAVIGVVNSAVSLFYYMKVVRAMFLTNPLTEEPMKVHRGYIALTGLLAVPTLVLGLYWAPLSAEIRDHLAFFRSAPTEMSAQK